jgi:hypothetical protein
MPKRATSMSRRGDPGINNDFKNNVGSCGEAWRFACGGSFPGGFLTEEAFQGGRIVCRELADEIFAKVVGGLAVDGGNGLIEIRVFTEEFLVFPAIGEEDCLMPSPAPTTCSPVPLTLTTPPDSSPPGPAAARVPRVRPDETSHLFCRPTLIDFLPSDRREGNHSSTLKFTSSAVFPCRERKRECLLFGINPQADRRSLPQNF